MFNSLSTTQGEVFYASDIKSFHRQSLQDLLALIAEEVEKTANSWKEPEWEFERSEALMKFMSQSFKNILSLLRSSLQVKE